MKKNVYVNAEHSQLKEQNGGTEMSEISVETTKNGNATAPSGHAVNILPNEAELSEWLHDEYQRTHWCQK